MKLNKKGFTIVELVIVIAVIAILAAVLIPTFSGVIDKAKNSALLEEKKNRDKLFAIEYAGKGDYNPGHLEADEIEEVETEWTSVVIDPSNSGAESSSPIWSTSGFITASNNQYIEVIVKGSYTADAIRFVAYSGNGAYSSYYNPKDSNCKITEEHIVSNGKTIFRFTGSNVNFAKYKFSYKVASYSDPTVYVLSKADE